MTPTQLKTFAAIARNGSSRAAASELGVSEAAVSGHVSALRKELGDELFRPTAAGLSFTPGGLRLATRSVEMLGLQDRTRREIRSASDGQRVLRLAVTSLFGEYAAPGMIELFTTRADDLEVEMSVCSPHEFEQLLMARAVDVAIGPAPRQVPSMITIKEFLRYQLVAVVGAGHRLAGRRSNAAELAGHDWLLGPSGVDPLSSAAHLLRRLGVPESNQRVFQNHAAALSEARAGNGIALSPAHALAVDAADGRLVRVDSSNVMVDGVWSTFSHRHDSSTSVAHELIRFVSTPRAIQSMLSGRGTGLARFRPHVHVTLWS